VFVVNFSCPLDGDAWPPPHHASNATDKCVVPLSLLTDARAKSASLFRFLNFDKDDVLESDDNDDDVGMDANILQYQVLHY
jgi:hypothetical protein